MFTISLSIRAKKKKVDSFSSRGVGAALGLPESRFRLILNKSELKDDNKRLVELGLGGLSNSVFMIERKDAEAA